MRHGVENYLDIALIWQDRMGTLYILGWFVLKVGAQDASVLVVDAG